MGSQSISATAFPSVEPKRLAFFERYFTFWLLSCMVAGVAFGRQFSGITSSLSQWEFGKGSQANVPIGVLLWLMIYPRFVSE